MMLGKATRSCAFLGSSSASRSTRSVFGRLASERRTSTSTTPFHYYASSSATTYIYRGEVGQQSRLFSSTSDESAVSKSRAPFRMPRNSADDSSQENSNTAAALSWNKLGLLTEICSCLQNELELPTPTTVQSLVIPQLLKTEKESMAFLAATGSGKTLSYVLPLVQQLKEQEMFESFERKPKRPRVLIMAPTRELAMQITSVVKSLSHAVKLSTQALVGGVNKGSQRKALENRPVDIVVATPGRLLQQWKDGNLFLGSVQTVVLDEMDTMLEQGFQRELRDILYPLLYAASPKEVDIAAEKDGWGGTKPKKKTTGGALTTDVTNLPLKQNAPQIVMTSATMTQSIQRLLGENPKTSKLAVTAKRLHGSHPGDAAEEKDNAKLRFPPMKIVSTPGLHKAIPRLQQIFVDVGNTDKVSLLLDVIASQRAQATIIFCNTASSVRAVQYALAEARIESFGYHGELNSAVRTENLQKFREIASDKSKEPNSLDKNKILVCTDIGARGLDIPQVDSVVMFDFPLNAMDYLHRSGRTARGAGKGKVTALVAKRDKVLATAIQQAVLRGDTLDGLSSRKSDYRPGAKFGVQPKKQKKARSNRRGAPPRGSRR
jgi:superfamily II DNA/RNA helicase